MKTIKDHSVTDHGVEHSQYFQGAGVALTRWEACYTGIGNSPGEALSDALEQLAMVGEYDHESLPEGWDEGLLALTDDKISPIIREHCDCEACNPCSGECECFEASELHCFVTLYVC